MFSCWYPGRNGVNPTAQLLVHGLLLRQLAKASLQVMDESDKLFELGFIEQVAPYPIEGRPISY